ncbi:MAG TPA: hypothetical protein VG963_29650 [Polyangiaceae bacterium]|nr:hypothetical protein [Polyangiaceae bacterium]
MNDLDQTYPGVAEMRPELVARLGALDRQGVDPDGRIHEAEVAVLAATSALHAARARTADLLEQKRVHERARAHGREGLQLEALLVAAAEHERACDVRRRQTLLDVAGLKLQLRAARYQECITGIVAELFQAFLDEAERFAQVYQATQRRPLVGFDAVAIALRALNVPMNSLAGLQVPNPPRNVPVTAETFSVAAAVEELTKGSVIVP